MEERVQIHEDARTVVLNQHFFQKVREIEEDAIWEVMSSSEVWTDRERCSYGAEKCSGYAMQRMGPKLVNCCRPEQMAPTSLAK